MTDVFALIDAPTIFRLAGFNANKSQWISGLNNIFYMVRLSYYRMTHELIRSTQFSTLICVFTLDRIGRRWTLYWGSVMQGIAMFLCGGFTKLAANENAAGNVAKSASYANAAASMIFIFTFTVRHRLNRRCVVLFTDDPHF